MSEKITVKHILEKKNKGEKIVMLTAYDYPLGVLLDRCGIDIVLVGDSLANVVLGLKSTRDVNMAEMLHHTKAVRRAVKQAFLVGDMPYESYQLTPQKAVENAKRFMDEAGCDAVKLEWFENCPAVVEEIAKAGIPVMGHVGLTPQTAEQFGGFKVQGKNAEAAQRIIEQARTLEAKGCFSVVLECIPAGVSEIITKILKVPTIGIGAGVHCDGQVLVTHDLLNLFEGFRPKFVKQYADVGKIVVEGVSRFRQEVAEGKFPGPEHSYKIADEELKKLTDG